MGFNNWTVIPHFQALLPMENSNALSTEQLSPFARRSDAIGRKANGLFLGVVCVGFVSFFGWASVTSLDEVTRGNGRIIPLQQNRNIQHMEGGIIADILVQEGDKIMRGDVLVRIENSFSLAELEQAKLELAAQRIQYARLTAETNGSTEILLAGDLRLSSPDVIAGEHQIIIRRSETLKQQLQIFDNQARQHRLSLSETQLRLKNKHKEYALTLEVVENFRKLAKSKAVSRNELLSRETGLQQLLSQINDMEYQIPAIKSELDEVAARQQEAILRFRSDAEKERSQTALAISKLNESITALQDRKSRTNVIAPIDGRINRLLVSTVGGVVQPGQTLAQIVPDDLSIAVDARLSPKDRANVWPGLESVVKVSAYDYTIFGGLKGTVTEISPDALQDDQGNPYFRVRVKADASALGADNPIVPGMLAEVNILTGSHTVLDYILKPVRRIKENAFTQ